MSSQKAAMFGSTFMWGLGFERMFNNEGAAHTTQTASTERADVTGVRACVWVCADE